MNDTNQPAFPVVANNWHRDGMTLREYAAIQLKVPSSGNEELDALIWESMRNDLAAKAMPAVWSNIDPEMPFDVAVTQTAEAAYELADAMMKACGQ
jgi:hypothetical protein